MKHRALICLSLLVFAASAQQPPAAAPGRARAARPPALRSAEILPDNRVTFRLRAASATEVALNGDWPDGRGVKLAKDDQGIWSVTVGPLAPELWYYTFSVDGATVVDPSNANLLRDGTRYMNFFVIAGPLSENYSIQDVPHGNVHLVWYDSPRAARQ
jgi:hypothetical protein